MVTLYSTHILLYLKRLTICGVLEVRFQAQGIGRAIDDPANFLLGAHREKAIEHWVLGTPCAGGTFGTPATSSVSNSYGGPDTMIYLLEGQDKLANPTSGSKRTFKKWG